MSGYGWSFEEFARHLRKTLGAGFSMAEVIIRDQARGAGRKANVAHDEGTARSVSTEGVRVPDGPSPADKNGSISP